MVTASNEKLTTQAPGPTPIAPSALTAKIGQTVFFYSDHEHVRGMKRVDDAEPFAAIVAWPVSERVLNLLVIDHFASTFPLERVPLFLGDDKDDKSALYHCEFEAPKPREIVALAGPAGRPIDLGLANVGLVQEGVALDSVKLTFIVPANNSLTFDSKIAKVKREFKADPAPQTLTITADQIALGALTDLSMTAAVLGDVSLAGTSVEQSADGRFGKKRTFTEAVTVGEAIPDAPPANAPAAPGTIMGAPPSVLPTPAVPAPVA